MKYLLDSNIFIQSSKEHYDMDVFPCFWDELLDLANQGIIFTLDKVEQEIMAQNDMLSQWFHTRFPSQSILQSDSSTISAYRRILNDVTASQRFTPTALNVFSGQDIADPFLCAYAMSHLDFTVVSYEKKNPDRKNKVLIPEVCIIESIPYIGVVSMFKSLNVRFEI